MNNNNYIVLLVVGILLITRPLTAQEKKRVRDHGIKIGVLKPGKLNAITDVDGLKVGHITIISNNVRTGVTAIVPHNGNLFQQKIPAAIFVGNGFGKLAGITQVQELGNIESPIILTNTLSVAAAIDAVIEYTLNQPGNENIQSVNAVVGETNDGKLNDIRGRNVTKQHVLEAIKNAKGDAVSEGNVGAGTGTVCFGFKGGIGTSSRVLPGAAGGYTVGVLVQTNFGGVLQIDGVPVAEEMGQFFMSNMISHDVDGSCMIVIATDAPVDARNLERMAMRAMMGLARTGGIASNGSGDYVVAFSTEPTLRIAHSADNQKTQKFNLLHNDAMSSLFLAVIEATEEAIINSLFMAESMTGTDGKEIKSLPIEEVLKIMKRYNAIKQERDKQE